MKKHFYLDEIVALCHKKHLSADEIFLQLKNKYQTIAQASVYRNLEKLVKEKKLKEIKLKNKSLYEAILEPHIHFFSDRGEVIDIPFDFNQIKLPYPDGYEPEHIEISIYWKKI